MRPEGGEAETSQPTPEGETGPDGEAVPFQSASPPRRTALSSAQLSPTRDGAQRACTTGIWTRVGSESGSPNDNPSSSSRQVCYFAPP